MSSARTKPVVLHLLYIVYGYDEHRVEVKLEYKVPPERVGNTYKIQEWLVEDIICKISPDMKHSNQWGCEVCGKRSRVTNVDSMYWTHLPEPRANLYLHCLCDDDPDGPCMRQINFMRTFLAPLTGPPNNLTPGRSVPPPGYEYPLTASCKNCGEEATAAKNFPMNRCSGCKLTRYCSHGCQKADWPLHKLACKNITSVKWFDDATVME